MLQRSCKESDELNLLDLKVFFDMIDFDFYD